MKNNTNKKSKPMPPVYATLGLAEKNRVDKKLKTTSPSTENVEQTREWSKENEL